MLASSLSDSETETEINLDFSTPPVKTSVKANWKVQDKKMGEDVAVPSKTVPHSPPYNPFQPVIDSDTDVSENEKKEQDVLGSLSFTVEKEEGKKKNKSEIDDNDKENEKKKEKEQNVQKTESKEPKIEESSDITKNERKDDKELSFEYVKLKEIDRMTKGRNNKALGDFEEVHRKKVSFGGEIDIQIGPLKKLIFPQKSQPKKSIIKQKQKKALENPETQKKIGLENIISQGKTQIIEEILKEARTQGEKNSVVLNSAQFFAKWKNLHQDKKSAFFFLQVLNKQLNKNIINSLKRA